MKTKNIYSQIANKGHLSLKSICFVFLAEIDQIIILSFEQNESDTTNTLGIFGLFNYKTWHVASILANIGRFYTIYELSI